jgi:hypothetical protein
MEVYRDAYRYVRIEGHIKQIRGNVKSGRDAVTEGRKNLKST